MSDSQKAPLEPKVKAAGTAVAVIGVVVTVAAALLEMSTALPAWVTAACTTVLAVAGALGFGYQAKHQFRDGEIVGRDADVPPRGRMP